jgi:hypothetical protein
MMIGLAFGSLGMPLPGVFGSLWVSSGFFGNLQISSGIFWNLWELLESHPEVVLRVIYDCQNGLG